MVKSNYFDVSRSDDVAISGWLMKQSPSLFVTQFQARYVVVTGNDKVLRYFKQEDDMKEAGSCYLTDIELVQQQNNEPDCRIFVIKMKQKDRLFVFESTNHTSMMTWVKAIKRVVNGQWSKGERTDVQDNNTSNGGSKGGSPASSPSNASNRQLDNVVKSGFLLKESSNKLVMNMQRRYIEISSDDNILRYFKNQSDPEPAGSLNLTLLEKVYRVHKEGSALYRFRLKSVLLDRKSLLLEASSLEDMESWIGAIKGCMPEHRRSLMDAATESVNSLKIDEPDLESLAEGGAGAGAGTGGDDHTEGGASATTAGIAQTSTSMPMPRSNSLTGRVVSQIFGRRTSDTSDASGANQGQGPGGSQKENVLSGFLEKKSGSKLVADLVKWQRRYVCVDTDGFIRYYKTEGDAADHHRALYSIDLRKVEFVRPYDTTDECSKFEVGDGLDSTDSKGVSNRVYLFDAGSALGRDRWVHKVSDQISKYEAESGAVMLLEDSNAVVAEKAPIVALYDSEGKDALLDHIKAQLESLYPPLWASSEDDAAAAAGGGEGNPFANEAGAEAGTGAGAGVEKAEIASTLDSHCRSAKAVLAYHASILKDVKKSKLRRARYDVMALCTDAVNRFLDLRLMLATMSGPAGSIDSATTAEMYTLITLLTGHQHALHKLYCPVSDRQQGGNGGNRGSRAGTIGSGAGAGSAKNAAGNQDGDTPPSPRDRTNTGATAITRGSVGTELHDIIISQGSTGASIVKSSNGYNVYRFHCEIFELLPDLCKRYIDGNKDIGILGTADVLVEQCAKIWQELVKNPADMIQMNEQDGSFYTEMPTLVWRSLHSHAHLAQEAGSTLLHVMVAAKIAASLVSMSRRTSNYVESIADIIAGDTELKEVELEYMCALANDIATHIEEVIALVDGFALAEVREKVNDNFDYVTEKLVASGQICLKRIIEVILTDVQRQFDEIWSESWLEDGKQLQVAIATIGDYMSDLQSWLMPFWYNKFTVMMCEEVTLRFTYAVLSGPERMATLERRGGGNNGSDDDDDGGDFEEVTGDMVTFGRVSKDINTLNAFFGSIFPDLQDRREELALSEGGMKRKDSTGALPLPGDSSSPSRATDSGGGGTGAPDDTADIIMIMELLNGLTTYLVADIHQSATRAAQKIAQFPSSAEAIGWFVTASLELRDDVDEDEMEEVVMILEPAMNSAPDAAFYNENNGIAEGRLGPVYDALFVLAGEPNYRGGVRDSGFGDSDSISLPEHLSKGKGDLPSVKGLGKSLDSGGGGGGSESDEDNEPEYDDDGNRIVSTRRRSVTAGGNSVTHRLKMMSNVPLAALKKSLEEVNRVLQSQVADNDEDFEGLSEEEQRARYETVKEERLQRARAVSKKRIRRDSFFQRPDTLMENAADLIAGAEEDAQEDFEQLRAAQDALDEIDREEVDLAKQTLKFQGYMERRALLGLWQSRCYKLDSRVVLDADGDEQLQHLFLEYNKKGGMLQESFPLTRMCRLTVKGGPRGVVFHTKSKSLILLTEACHKGMKESDYTKVYTLQGDVDKVGAGGEYDSKYYSLEYQVSPEYPQNNPKFDPIDKLHQQPHLIRTDNEKKFLHVMSMLVGGCGFIYDGSSGSFVRPTAFTDNED